jgi:lactobin A/cerein 7B family class IIb bacteriocin
MNLNELDVVEMNHTEMTETEGGIWPLVVIGVALIVSSCGGSSSNSSTTTTTKVDSTGSTTNKTDR